MIQTIRSQPTPAPASKAPPVWDPFFIVGAGRSGTTLLRRLLNRHSQLCVPVETKFIPEKVDAFVTLLRRGQPEQAAALLNKLPLLREWGIRLEGADLAGTQGMAAYAQAVDCIMRRRAAQDGKPYWGEKTPWYILHIETLGRLFPGARFIHIYRDGRDVALSVMPLSWGPNNAYASGCWWRRQIAVWDRAKARLGANAFEVRYEAFIQAPEQGLRQVCDFLEISFEEDMLHGYAIKQGNFQKWKNGFYMSPCELAAFEVAAGQTLRRLGYEPALARPRFPVWRRWFAQFDDRYKRLSNFLLRRN